MNSNHTPIDAVIAWVDGNDPAHKAKRHKYSRPEEISNDDIGGDIRFTSIGEIQYSVASILRFAPYIRTIYIVTDNQDPGLGDFIDKYFPDRTTSIEIVDHKVLYQGFEEYLPVFNSLSIETMIWRIPGLAERFIYLNDDMMLAAPTMPHDFFTEDGLICYASHMSVKFAEFLRWAKHLKRGHKIFGFKDSMINAAELIGERKKFLLLGHNPYVGLKSIFEEFYAKRPDALASNASHRFRDPSQFNPQELCYLLAERAGRCEVRSRKGMELYIKPKRKPGYVASKLKRFDTAPGALFCCMNSVDYATPEDQKLIIEWLKSRIGLL